MISDFNDDEVLILINYGDFIEEEKFSNIEKVNIWGDEITLSDMHK
jgi:hypothetical protein